MSLRRIAIGIGVFILVLIGAAALSFAFRGAIVEPLLARRLGALLHAPVQLSVEAVSLRSVRATDVQLGENEELRIDVATVRFRLRSPLRIELEDVALEGVGLKVDMTGGGPILGSLQSALVSDGSGGPGFRLPNIAITNGRINVALENGTGIIALEGHASTDDAGVTGGTFRIGDATFTATGETIGALRGEGDFELGQDRALSLNATLRLEQSSPRLAPVSSGEIVVVVTGDTFSIDGSLHEAEGAASLVLGSTIANYRGEPAASFRLSARAESQSDLWTRLNLSGPSGGAAELLLEGTVRLPAIAALRESASPFDYLLDTTDMDGTLDVVLVDLVHDRIGKFNGALKGDLALRAGSLSLDVREGVLLDVSEFPEGLPAPLPDSGDRLRFSVPRDRSLVARISKAPSGYLVTGEGSLSALGAAEAALRIDTRLVAHLDEKLHLKSLDIGEYLVRLAGVESRRGLDVEGGTVQASGVAAFDEEGHLNGTASIQANAVRLGRGQANSGPTRIQAKVDFDWNGTSANIRLRDSGEIHVGSPIYGETISISGPFRAQVHRLDLTVSNVVEDADVPRVRFLAQVDPEDFIAEFGAPSGETMTLEVAASPLLVEGTSAVDAPISSTITTNIRLTARDQQAVLNGLRAQVTMDPDASSLTARFDVARLVHAAKSPVIAPLSLSGAVSVIAGRIEGSGRLFHAGDEQLASVELSSATNVTRLSLVTEELSFSPGGRQPKDLFPSVDFLRSANGSVQARATATWRNGVRRSQGALELNALSFASPRGRVRSLQGMIAFDDLWPPSTPAGQRLAAEAVSIALPTEMVDIVFQILGDDPLRIHLEEGRAGFVGGTLSTSAVSIDLSRSVQTVVTVKDIDLKRLLALFAVDGLSGSGTIEGEVPISVLESGALVIRDARLRSRVPGVIRLKSETVAKALRAGGESVDLMLRALEDFRYQTLVLSADKAQDGEATILLRLMGQNPDVLEGQPFDFNIRLGTNLDTIAEAVRQGLGISGNFVGNLR